MISWIYAYSVGFGATANNGPIIVSGGKSEISGSQYGLTANDSGITFSDGRLIIKGGSEALGNSGPAIVTAWHNLFKTNTDTEPPDLPFTSSHDMAFENSDTFKYIDIASCPVFVGGQDVSGVTDAATYWLKDGNGSITDTGTEVCGIIKKFIETVMK